MQILEMLKQKTQGNLDEQETQLIDTLLKELRGKVPASSGSD
jgi:hypothetical protein